MVYLIQEQVNSKSESLPSHTNESTLILQVLLMKCLISSQNFEGFIWSCKVGSLPFKVRKIY